MTRALPCSASLLALLLTTGCGGGDTDAAATGTGGGDGLNGCTTYVDQKGKAVVVVAFGGAAGSKYTPACVVITAGAKISFQGDFGTHPLSGGVPGSPDNSGPIAHTATGDIAEFTFNDVGDYGYYCEVHGASGMLGAVRVKN